MGLQELCEKYFKTSNLYEVLQITENASEKEVKKAYHKLSLKVHPDRVAEHEKLEATEKFKVLGSIHAILTDTEKRKMYDDTKCVDDEDFNAIVNRDWSWYWGLLFKKITHEDIKSYENEYIGSALQKEDIKQSYLNSKGDMNFIIDHVPFARTDQEPKIREIVNEMIKNGEIPAYKLFTHEPASKRLKRIAKEKREAKQAEKEKRDENDSEGLEVMLKKNQQKRAQQIDSFIDELAAKYGGGSKPKPTKRKIHETERSTKNKKKK